MEPSRRAVASTMAQVARTLNAPRQVEDTLEAIVSVASVSIPGFSHVGVSPVHHDGEVETLTASDQLVRDLDAGGATPSLAAAWSFAVSYAEVIWKALVVSLPVRRGCWSGCCRRRCRERRPRTAAWIG